MLAVIFAVLPVEQQTAEYAWEPATDGAQVPLLLVERTPDEFQLTFPCDLATGAERQLFMSSRSPDEVPSLSVRGGESRVTVEVPAAGDDPAGERLNAGMTVGATGECTVSYDRAAARLAAASPADSAVLTVPDGAFELTGLHWTGEPRAGVRAELQTAAFSMVRNSLPQKLVLGTIALLALASAVLAVVQRHRRSSRPEEHLAGPGVPPAAARRRPRAGWWRAYPSEWAMLLVAVTVAVVDLPRADDGRILGRARVLADLELSANVSNLFENRIVPQRWLYEWVLGTSVGWSSSVLVIRLLSVIAVVAAWMLIRRRVLPRLLDGALTKPTTAIAWTVHAAFVVAWSATIRPEPVVILLVTVVLAVIASWPGEPRAWPSAVVVAAVGIAAATHVAGLAVALAALPAAGFAFGELRRDFRRAAVPVGTGIAWGTTVSVVTFFLGSNVSHIAMAVSGFGGDAHGYDALDTLLYLSTIEDSTAPMMLATGLGVVGALVALAAAVRLLEGDFHGRASAVLVAASLAPFALFLTPSKWLWHLAILAPTAVVGWVLIARRMELRRAPSLAVLVLLGSALGLITAWAMRPVWKARMLTGPWQDVGLRELSPGGWASYFPRLAGPDVRWWLWSLILVAVLVAVTLLAPRRGPMRRVGSVPLASGLLVCLAAVSAVQLSPPVVDAIRAGDEWTFVRQSVGGLVSTEESCGVPAATPAVVSRAQLDGARFSATGGEIAGHSGVYFFAPCHDSMRQEEGVWQVPGLLMGELTHDLPRAAYEYDVRPIGCNSFPYERAEGRLCFYALVPAGDELSPSAVRWDW